ncbi:ATP-binding cassette domain-containing protein [Streptomyces cinnamoneus]|nr:ATP-binding cassette domain-containing protein [Streptomyces cinnamoneus]
MRLMGVGRRYGLGGPWVLRDVDLDVPAGALLRIEGANGSGKSTLLRLIAGIDVPSAGRVTDRPRTAYVPERFPPALPFTAVGYLTAMGRVHGLGRAAAARAAREWLERFGAGHHARTRLAELSKGTSQKVAVAQGLLAAPGLLVLDEAWTGLDPASRTVLDGAVADRVAAGGTVVFVDHDPRRLAAAADAVHRVEAGRLRQVETAAARSGPLVRIEAEGAAGAVLPQGLPGGPVAETAAAPGDGERPLLRLSVGAAHSDALLTALLTARPPWHIRTLTTEQGTTEHATTGKGLHR